jgi:hypothetical protein
MVEAARAAAYEPPVSTFKRKGLSTTELQNCQRAFKAMDKEHSGTISLNELAKVCCHTAPQPFFPFARAAISPPPAAEHAAVWVDAAAAGMGGLAPVR